MEELEGLSLVELRIMAKNMGIKSVTSYRKKELYDLIVAQKKKESQKRRARNRKRKRYRSSKEQKTISPVSV